MISELLYPAITGELEVSRLTIDTITRGRCPSWLVLGVEGYSDIINSGVCCHQLLDHKGRHHHRERSGMGFKDDTAYGRVRKDYWWTDQEENAGFDPPEWNKETMHEYRRRIKWMKKLVGIE